MCDFPKKSKMDIWKMSSAMAEMAVEKLKTENKLRRATDEISKLREIIDNLELQTQLISGEKADMLNQLDSKGYGEQGNSENETVFQNITQLREKIQLVIIRNAGDKSYLLQLIENLCTSYDKLCDKVNKEKEDLERQKLQAEQEMIQHTVPEQLLQIEAMRGQLEEQKQNASFEQRQATSQLELQLHDVNAKLHKKKQTLEMKELELKNVRIQLSEVSQLLNDKQEEIIKTAETEEKKFDNMRAEYKDLIDKLTSDKLFYKNQYELCQESENKLRKDLVEVENNLKVKTEDLEKIMQQYTEIRQELKEVNKFNEGLNLEEDELDQELSKSLVIEYENRIIQIKTVIDKDNQRLSKTMSDAEEKRQKLRSDDQSVIKNLEVIINNSETDRINMKRELKISKNELTRATQVIQGLRKSEIKLQRELSQLCERMNELTCANERYSDEKIVLYNKLLRARGKQKALIFQKHYLYRVIGDYQSINDNILSVIAQLTDSERTYINERKLDMEKKNPKARFRCIALMIIGVHRMKWAYCKDGAEDCE